MFPTIRQPAEALRVVPAKLALEKADLDIASGTDQAFGRFCRRCRQSSLQTAGSLPRFKFRFCDDSRPKTKASKQLLKRFFSIYRELTRRGRKTAARPGKQCPGVLVGLADPNKSGNASAFGVYDICCM